ncbi:hypothetical protein BJX70DRAFT_366921 [Aspergillus crustosus]
MQYAAPSALPRPGLCRDYTPLQGMYAATQEENRQWLECSRRGLPSPWAIAPKGSGSGNANNPAPDTLGDNFLDSRVTRLTEDIQRTLQLPDAEQLHNRDVTGMNEFDIENLVLERLQAEERDFVAVREEGVRGVEANIALGRLTVGQARELKEVLRKVEERSREISRKKVGEQKRVLLAKLTGEKPVV